MGCACISGIRNPPNLTSLIFFVINIFDLKHHAILQSQTSMLTHGIAEHRRKNGDDQQQTTVWLIDRCLTGRQHRIVNLSQCACRGGKPTDADNKKQCITPYATQLQHGTFDNKTLKLTNTTAGFLIELRTYLFTTLTTSPNDLARSETTYSVFHSVWMQIVNNVYFS